MASDVSNPEKDPASAHPLYMDILHAIKDRTEWEMRQALFYRMRYMGIRRKFKPYPGCADQHFPLCDGLIERDKPFYYQQLYVSDTLASFVSLKAQDDGLSTAVGSWFDYRLKQKSNFEQQILAGIDQMEQNGRTPVKLYWDNEKNELCFQQIDPRHFIVPRFVDGIQESPWLVHVISMNDSDYKANPNFKQDPDFVKSITGKGTGTGGGVQGTPAIYKDQEVLKREGLTLGGNDHEIILWEVYEKVKEGSKWRVMVSTFSPLRPNIEDRVRDDFESPFEKGIFSRGDRYPFGSLQMEITGGDWYSPRGNVEINAAFETSMCRTWNAKLDWMDFFNRPTYSSPSGRDFGSIANIKCLPGQVLPGDLQPNQAPPPPVSFDDEMDKTRALAEWRTKVPDLGAEQHLVPGSSGNVTATQINAIVGQSGQAEEMRSRVFRLCMADIYRMAYSIYLQYDTKDLQFVIGDLVQDINENAFHDAYLIMPNGSADSWNKQLMLQKAVALYQMSVNNGYANQKEAWKIVLEWMEPRWVKRVFQDPQLASTLQMEQQAEEIAIMTLGFPAQVQLADDDKAHLLSMQGFIDRRRQTGEAISGELARLMLAHYQAHENQLAQKKDPEFFQIRQAAKPYLLMLSNIAASDQGPPNVVAGPGAPPTSAAPASGSANVKQLNALDYAKFQAKTDIDKQKAAAAVINALANAIKSGVKITNADINGMLTQAGLPPMAPPDVVPQVSPNAA
jgi:hypothetical protein